MDDETEELEEEGDELSNAVDMIASGYEWVCPNCGVLNPEIEHTPTVTCKSCQRLFPTNPPEHAYH